MAEYCETEVVVLCFGVSYLAKLTSFMIRGRLAIVLSVPPSSFCNSLLHLL